MFAQVAVPLPLPGLTYRVPDGLKITPGCAVKVRIRKKIVDGIILERKEAAETGHKFNIHTIEGLSDDFPELSADTLRYLEWAADYYQCPIGEVLRTFLPPDPAPRKLTLYQLSPAGAGQKPKGKVQAEILARLADGNPHALNPSQKQAAKKLLELGWIEPVIQNDLTVPQAPAPQASAFSPTEGQAKALEEIRAAQEAGQFQVFLLQGVTGSGKTEVYLRAASYCLNRGKNVLVVVPEIALTPQLVSRFKSRLGENIAVLHSGISDGERSRQWHLLNQGRMRVCIGARSASFAPIGNLGLVIVDEEHDSALKQEDHLRYNARDLAVMRGKQSSATVLLGSATPSLETYHNAQTGRYRHIILPERATGGALPDVKVIDRSKDSGEGSISIRLRLAMEECLKEGGQVMLLLNRRGFSSFVICKTCGDVPECPNCSVSLTHYKNSRLLKCHYCAHTEKIPEACFKCGSQEILSGTLGTESLEEEVKSIFPGRRVIRIDRESTERKGSLESALAMIASGEAEIIIGTQIIAKGHDFPNIALVAVVNADSSFHLPDFRASEKSFQLFTQMAGRAGRGERPGKVFLQTLNPLHPSIVHSTNHDYRSFAEEEMRIRHAFQYPPYSRMARVVLSAPSPALAEKSAERVYSFMSQHSARLQIEIVGPSPAALAKIQNRHRWHLILKCAKAGSLHSLLLALREDAPKILDRKVLVQVDVDPVSLM